MARFQAAAHGSAAPANIEALRFSIPANEQRRHAEVARHGGRSLHEAVRTPDQQYQTEDNGEKGIQDGISRNYSRFALPAQKQLSKKIAWTKWSLLVIDNRRREDDMHGSITQQRFCGRDFSAKEVSLIQEVVDTCGGLSRNEMANTVCELLEWKRPNGRLKNRECLELLSKLEDKGLLTLPDKRQDGNSTPRKRMATVQPDAPYSALTGSVEEFAPLLVERVERQEQRVLFKDLLARYHYLGYAMPFGARIQYLVYVSRPRREVVGCLQFSSPAWRMKARDQWIGWHDKRREEGLQQVVNNSRFLVLASIRNLASAMLSAALRRLKCDWERQYGIEPLLLETLVDRERFHGGCYRSANWLELGQTTGRGRMDRANSRHGAQVKTILVYPLAKHAVRRLRDGR